jgi:hypothetical protein
MGVGTEVYVPLILGRRAVGIELKPSYFRQAVKNVSAAAEGKRFDVTTEEMVFGSEEDFEETLEAA